MTKSTPSVLAEWLLEAEKVASALSVRLKSLSRSIQTAAGAIRARPELDEVGSELRQLSQLENRRLVIMESLSDLYEHQLLTLEGDTRSRLREEGWFVDGEWPQLIVQRGVDVEYDVNARVFVVSGHRIPALDLDQLVERLHSETKDLLPKGFAPAKFLEQLGTAYDTIKRAEPTVAIATLYKQAVYATQSKRFWLDARPEHFVSLTRDQFRARLTACLDAGCQELRDGRQLRLLPPIDPKDALFMYQPAERRFAFVGRVSFVPGLEAAHG
jgi:hypothetical protein